MTVASKSIQACGHMARQALRARPRRIARAESDDFVHGDYVTNRAEKRAAHGIAKLYGCDPYGEHSKLCPKYGEPSQKKNDKPAEELAAK